MWMNKGCHDSSFEICPSKSLLWHFCFMMYRCCSLSGLQQVLQSIPAVSGWRCGCILDKMPQCWQTFIYTHIHTYSQFRVFQFGNIESKVRIFRCSKSKGLSWVGTSKAVMLCSHGHIIHNVWAPKASGSCCWVLEGMWSCKCESLTGGRPSRDADITLQPNLSGHVCTQHEKPELLQWEMKECIG